MSYSAGWDVRVLHGISIVALFCWGRKPFDLVFHLDMVFKALELIN